MMEQAQTQTGTVRVLVFQEDGMFVAQCVDYDIGAQGRDLDELRRRFKAVLAADIEESVSRNGSPFAGIDKAPACYEHMWNSTQGLTPIGGSEAQPTNSAHVPYELALCA